MTARRTYLVGTIAVTVALSATLLVVSNNSAAQVESTHSFIVPHFIEAPGLATQVEGTYDHTFHFAYQPDAGANDPNVDVSLFLYDEDGEPLRAKGVEGKPVCNPCVRTLSPEDPKKSFVLNRLINQAGGFPADRVTGFAVATVSNDDANVNMVNFVVNSITGPLQISVFETDPETISATAAP